MGASVLLAVQSSQHDVLSLASGTGIRAIQPRAWGFRSRPIHLQGLSSACECRVGGVAMSSCYGLHPLTKFPLIKIVVSDTFVYICVFVVSLVNQIQSNAIPNYSQRSITFPMVSVSTGLIILLYNNS